ncbi:MAG: response regulator [Eubacterium sp.]|nr:response regulator [Eubacterium sp.]
MDSTFAKILKDLRHEKGLSQQQLAQLLSFDRSSIANWENGRRIPDIDTIRKISECLEIDISCLIGNSSDKEKPKVIIVDDEPILIDGVFPIMSWAMPKAEIKGFTKPSEAVDYVKNCNVSIAFLDIEIGTQSGLDLSKKLININPLLNIIFLTSFSDYALDAWESPACGFLVKPIQLDDVELQLNKLRHPVRGLI